MTDFVANPTTDGLVRLSGTITGYSVRRESASFVFTETDQTKFGVIAIAASLAGMGGQAMAMASNATALEEEADHVEFAIDGRKVSGWLWRSPFKEGDVVDVAAEWRGDHYECLGVARPADRTIALYPHCTRAKKTHIKNAIKWWIYASLIFEVLLLLLASTLESITLMEFLVRIWAANGGWILLGIHVFIAIAIYSMARKWLPFTKVAEKVFKVLGLPNAANVDLVKSSKGKHQATDAFEYGAMFFRY